MFGNTALWVVPSEIYGSKPTLGSPWLIAEYHVLHTPHADHHKNR